MCKGKGFVVVFIFLSPVLGFVSDKCPPPFHLDGISDLYHDPPPEAFMDPPEIIAKSNYPVETHEVRTEDGYILTLFRIPHSNRTGNEGVDKEPVLVQHGLMCSSSDWLVLDTESNLPFILANLGFDVWMGNARGSSYSQRHEFLGINSTEYWDFSFHEMGTYDIPAVINYILAETGKQRMSYVGHSMGTTMFFIAMDKHRELQSKALSHIFSQDRVLSPALNKWMADWGPFLCSGDVPSCWCRDLMYVMTGFDHSQSSPRTSSIVAGHTPNPTSGKTLNHYTQWGRVPRFQEFDYGLFGNLKKYGTPFPPTYNLSVNYVETFVMYSFNDWLQNPVDALRTIRELGNATGRAVSLPLFTHMDYMYANDVKRLVYDYSIDFLLS